MAPRPRRRLFWRVYAALVVSLLLVAVVGGTLGRIAMVARSTHHGVMMHSRPPAAVHMTLFLMVVGGAVGLAAYPVMSRLTRRLEALGEAVAAWRPDQQGHRAPVDGDDEITAVAVSFNRAAERAEALLAAHKTLLAHASHELRSPLARLRLASENYAADPKPERLTAITREIVELDGLVDEILLASRLDQSADAPADESVDCLALAAEEAARAGVSLADVDQDGGSFVVRGSPRLLRRMIRNLIDNAIKHGARPIEVVLRSGTGDLELCVSDHGAGVPEALRERVFDPFFRPSGHAEDGGSWGLGLSLVRQIAARHGGAARCAREGGVTRFCVRLPRAT